MPSGSHGGGGGGSHHGGGFGGGGNRFGRGRPTGGLFRRSVPIRIWFFGHHYYVPADKSNKLRAWFTSSVILLIIGLIALFASFGAKAQINQIRSDREYYINMIEYATLHPEFQKTGIITDKFQNYDNGKCYLTYSLQTANGETLKGYTYSVYTLEEINQFVIGQEIKLAVNSNVITLSTDSITMDYINIPIEKDGEYITANALKKNSTIFMIVMFSVSAICLAVGIYKTKKEMQLNELEKEKTSSSFVEENVKRCPYCGSKQNPDEKKCPNCGASFID